MKKESISISIPAWNEQETIERVALEALAELKKTGLRHELLLIDTGSKDKTAEIINRLSKKNKEIRVIHKKVNTGFSGSITEALKNAKTDLVFLAPADGQFRFKQIHAFLEVIKYYDVAFAYRVINEEPIHRKIQSFVFHRLCSWFLGIHLRELTSISLWRKKVLDDVKLRVETQSNNALPDFINQASQKGYTFAEVPINWRKRQGGKAKGVINFKLIWDTIKEFNKLRKLASSS